LKDFRGFAFGPWPGWLADLQHRLHDLPVERVREELQTRGLDPGSISFSCTLEGMAVRAETVAAEGITAVFDWLRGQQAILARRPPAFCHGDFFPNQVLAEHGRVTGVIYWTDACFAPAELDVVEVRVALETLPVPLGSLGPRVVRARAQRFYDAYHATAPQPDAEVEQVFQVLRCARSLVAVAERGATRTYQNPGRCSTT
jgi:aminoglycoside phosphotransferase (APT) family kinase protein